MFLCVYTNLNELLVRYIATVKRLLVVHKAREFSLLHFLAAQHQHSGGEHTLNVSVSHLEFHCTSVWQALTVFDPRKTEPACHLSLCLPLNGAATNLEGNSGENLFFHHFTEKLKKKIKRVSKLIFYDFISQYTINRSLSERY